ncbi:LOW QUALITY PROTEIN: protein NUCLEOLAR FACTOR 1 [Prosopis cineraria]|uniref:LOW QUALITY PROTEIN: protein NUCLEOLAR FACTOR 1 n=1 Tax=Prosopis cineraria TaxID=364024 RepID=UPI00240F636D|nr:LOW QUALITY PROTEIN: protein NUCLEOLAR FACTOR 1 [Prosopis cineraria]
MASRPELLAPPEIFYDDTEARKYTSSSRIIEIQAILSERALELLASPDDGIPKLLLDNDRHRPKKKQKHNKSGKGREWILRKKEQMRRRGNLVPPDTKYTVSDDESPRSKGVESMSEDPEVNDSRLSEGSKSDGALDLSLSDEEDTEINGRSTPEDSVQLSSFDLHLQHSLSKEEINDLRNWEYKWEVPANGMSNCKWTGTGNNILEGLDFNSCDGLKPKLYQHWMEVYQRSGGKAVNSSLQKTFFSLCNSYRDILHCNKRPFYHKGLEDMTIMDAYIMHSLNHVFRTRDLVKKNEAKLAKLGETADVDEFRDQGFTRPKVLILLPFASIVFRVVKRLIQLTPPSCKLSVEHMDRFSTKFGSEDDKGNDQMDENGQESGNAMPQKSYKGSDFQALFGGNNEDNFMIGIKFTRKTIKLFSDFHTSDIIVASPLCLVNKIDEAKSDKEKDVDYLSSIEVLIVDHADVIAMQDWSHVHTVLERLNCLPSKQPGTNVMRIRPWYLDDYAKFYRQTIILGFYSNQDINGSFNHQCSNYQGKVKLICEYKGLLHKVLPQIPQIYERFNVDSMVDADARFHYFVKKVFPRIKESDQGGIMIFISSYFDFIRIRNFLKSQDASFCLLGEYTTHSDISRARLWFFEQRRKIMLYTERSHFYHRYKIRGVKNLIIYSLPERKEFYPEIVNMLDGSDNNACTVLFSRLDKSKLERIVGTTAAIRMVLAEKGVFVFSH